MPTAATANDFAIQWIHAWNSHNMESILSHYDDEIEFYSPLVSALDFNHEGVIRGKSDLKRYFETGLKKYPDLNFQFHQCLAGVNTLVICYTSVNDTPAAEVFELNENNKAKRVLCNYAI